jgi:hypothetical protein
MATVKLAPNVAVAVKAKYIDLVPGQYGTQVRIKGTMNGEDGVIYCPGKAWAALKSLRAALVIDPNQQVDEETKEPVELGILRSEFSLMSEQPAGQKYGTLKVSLGNGQQSVVANNDAEEAKELRSVTASPIVLIPASLSLEAVVDEYVKVLDLVLATVVPRLVKADIGASPESINATCATILIQRQKASGR